MPPQPGPEGGLFGRSLPFEVWVNGSEQPRGLGALAKALSLDMRANDAQWLKLGEGSLQRALAAAGAA